MMKNIKIALSEEVYEMLLEKGGKGNFAKFISSLIEGYSANSSNNMINTTNMIDKDEFDLLKQKIDILGSIHSRLKTLESQTEKLSLKVRELEENKSVAMDSMDKSADTKHVDLRDITEIPDEELSPMERITK